MNRRALILGVGAVAVVAFAGAAALYPRAAEPTAAPVGQESNLVRFHSPVVGRADAPVTIVEFLDPSCEACRAFYPYVKNILSENPEDVRLVIRYAPLHEGSDEAVRILEAARRQKKFDEVLEALFRDQDQWAMHGQPDMEKAWAIASTAGLDVSRAREDARSEAVGKVLEQDIADMKAVNLQGTPTFYINNKPLAEFGPQQLTAQVEAEVKAARAAKPGA